VSVFSGLLDSNCGCENQVFVLGSDRSGTTITKNIVSGMLGQPKLRFEPRLLIDGTLQKGVISSVFKHQSDREKELSVKWVMRQYYISEQRGWHLYFTKEEFEEAVKYVVNAEIDKEDLVRNLFYSCHQKVARISGLNFNSAIDDTPSNVLIIDFLVKLFPGCKVIHCIRDGREVAASIIERNWWGGHFRSAVSEWYRRVSVGRGLGKMYPDNYMELSLCSVRNNKQEAYGRVAEFLGVKGSYDLEEFDSSRGRPTGVSRADNEFFLELCGGWAEEFGWV